MFVVYVCSWSNNYVAKRAKIQSVIGSDGFLYYMVLLSNINVMMLCAAGEHQVDWVIYITGFQNRVSQ